MFNKMHHLDIIDIIEHFDNSINLMNFKIQLEMENVIINFNGKIWLLWKSDVHCIVRDQDEHQITCDFSHNDLQNKFIMTFVYAKYKDYLRRPPWDKLLQQAENEDEPWCSFGDYSVITSTKQKLGGIRYNIRKN